MGFTHPRIAPASHPHRTRVAPAPPRSPRPPRPPYPPPPSALSVLLSRRLLRPAPTPAHVLVGGPLHRCSVPLDLFLRLPRAPAKLKLSVPSLRKSAMRMLSPRHRPPPADSAALAAAEAVAPPLTTLASSPRRHDSCTPALPAATFAIFRRLNPAPATGPAEPWITAALLVAFHLEQGPVVEACFPPHALTLAQQEAVCFHAMPDSAAAGAGREDLLYTFRLLAAPGSPLLAHALFRQAEDPSNPRGAFQKALVLVSPAPCLTLFARLLHILAGPAFVGGAHALRAAVADVAAWPDPRVQTDARELVLGVGGCTLEVGLPRSFLRSFAAPSVVVVEGKGGSQKAAEREDLEEEEAKAEEEGETSLTTRFGERQHLGLREGADDDQAVRGHPGASVAGVVREWPLGAPCAMATAAPFHEVDMTRALHGVHDRLWTLWELLVLGEPLLVVAATPPECASAVLALVGLIHPLPFVGDWRPYFCIHDAAFASLSGVDDITAEFPAGAVYGVTNRHLAETLGFPNVLTVGHGKGAGNVLKPGLETRHRSSLHKSRVVMDAMSKGVSPSSPQNVALWETEHAGTDVRACVLDKITRPFLRAFDRYLVPTWDGGRPVTSEPYASDPFGRELGLVGLDMDKFPTAEDLASPGVATLFRSNALSKKRVRKLYSRFAAGPVFRTWWGEARAAARQECAVLHRTDLMEACVRGTGVVRRQLSKDEAGDVDTVKRVVDLCSRVQQELLKADEDDYALREKLETLLDSLSKPLPDDMRIAMSSVSAL